MARLRFLIEECPVPQRLDPGVYAVNRLRDGASADPVADNAPDVGIAAQVLHVQPADHRFPRQELVHVYNVRRDFVHQRVAGVDVHRVQVAGHDVRPQVDRPAVAGMPVLDLLRGGRNLCRRDVARKVDVQLVEVVVRRLDDQVADGRVDDLRVVRRQARYV